MKSDNYFLGKLGEDIAEKHLRGKGLKIIAKNFSTKFGEVDIVAVDSKILVFVEVKLKIGEAYGSPEEMINTKKLTQITNTAQMFLLKYKSVADSYTQYRIDVVAIVLDKEQSVDRITHYENISE